MYIAELHQGEEVLTAKDPRNVKNGGNTGGNISFSPNINIEVKGNATEDTARDISDEVVKVMNKEFKKLLLQMS